MPVELELKEGGETIEKMGDVFERSAGGGSMKSWTNEEREKCVGRKERQALARTTNKQK